MDAATENLCAYINLLGSDDPVDWEAMERAQTRALGVQPSRGGVLILRYFSQGKAKTATFSGVDMHGRALDAARRVLGWVGVTDVTLRWWQD